jgi:hypothetical protein
MERFLNHRAPFGVRNARRGAAISQAAMKRNALRKLTSRIEIKESIESMFTGTNLPSLYYMTLSALVE